MIIFNGVRCETIEQLEELIVDLSDYQKQCLRNDFNGIPNPVQVAIKPVTPRQMRIALIMSGFSLDSIEDTINSLTEPQRSIVRVTWEYSVEFQRDNPVLNSMAGVLGLTSQQIDNLFTLAATL